MASPNVLASKQLRRSARLQNNSSGLSSQQNQPPLRTTSVAPLPPPRPVVANATTACRQSDDASSSSRRHGASGCADSAPPPSPPAPEPEHDDEGREDEGDKLLRRQFNEKYAPLLEKTRAKMNEYQMAGDKRVENLLKKFIACRLEQFKKKSCIHQCTGCNRQCDCSIGSVNMDPDESGGSPNNLPQDYNESFEEEGNAESKGAELENDLPTSGSGEIEETSDDDEAIEGEDEWDLKEVIAVKDLNKRKPKMCQEEGCTSGMPMPHVFCP